MKKSIFTLVIILTITLISYGGSHSTSKYIGGGQYYEIDHAQDTSKPYIPYNDPISHTFIIETDAYVSCSQTHDNTYAYTYCELWASSTELVRYCVSQAVTTPAEHDLPYNGGYYGTIWAFYYSFYLSTDPGYTAYSIATISW